MSESESGAERTEEPTPKRLQDARDQGNIPRSQELGIAVMFIAICAGLVGLGGFITRGAVDWMRQQLGGIGKAAGHGSELFGQFGESFLTLFLYAIPLILLCLVAGFVSPIVMGGLRFSSKSLTPKFDRLSPLAGIKRMWGTQSLIELSKSLLRVGILGTVAWLYFSWHKADLLALIHQPLEVAIDSGLGLALGTLLAMSIALSVVAAIDAPYQKWTWKKKLMMTRQEVIDEMKETDGKPEVKAAIRRAQQQASQRRMMEDVPKADVVLVNPTHYAVAIKYDGGSMKAPRVVAKGVDEIALSIRKLADASRVPIVASPPLARALYREVEIGREIPVKLYSAVAQILSYVYQLRTWVPGRTAAPSVPVIDIPDAPEA